MAGGTVVTVTGSGFTGTVGVALHAPTGADAGTASFTVVSDSELMIVMPATMTPGWVHVSINTTTASTGAFVPADQFTYLPPSFDLGLALLH